MSRITEDDSQRQEYLRRALSPGENAMSSPLDAAYVLDDIPSPVPRSTEAPPLAMSLTHQSAQVQMTTRMPLRDHPPPLTETQYRTGQRNVMLAGAMILSLFCGVALLVFASVTIVPAARDRLRQRYASTPYEAVLWCPTCARAGKPIGLLDRPGQVFSNRAGTLRHGTTVTVIAEEWAMLEGCMYLEIQAPTERGWVRSTHVRR